MPAGIFYIMKLEDLEIYILAREISNNSWEVYKNFDWQIKKVCGDQFIEAIDSVGANIAEGWGRYHFLDRNKFNYNARGSLLESLHWLSLLAYRNLISAEQNSSLKQQLETLHLKLNNYINSTKDQIRK